MRWFLDAGERGNHATDLESEPWTSGNAAQPLIHGRTYFSRLHTELMRLEAGDRMHFVDWRGDAEQRLLPDDPASTVGRVLTDLARRGAQVRGLVWRSHPDQEKFSEQEAIHLAEVVNKAGGELYLDARVRRGGSHHQKLVVLMHPGREERDVAFVGGIDLCVGRNDDERHLGDAQPIAMDRRYGSSPAWHDIQLEVRGPAVTWLAETFRERWNDPTPLDHRNPLRARIRHAVREPVRAQPIETKPPRPPQAGSLAIQVLRTYPSKRPPYPFAPGGERSVARAYARAFGNARSLIYLEDQYMWSKEIAHHLAAALSRAPELRLIAVVPRYPDRDGLVSGPPQRIGQIEALEVVRRAGGDRVAVFDLENEAGRPIYVHAKACVIDDVWAAVGSDNLNRRSWTHDSEVSCAVIDSTLDDREPKELGEDAARVFARDLRLALWREHLDPDVDEQTMLDPVKAFDEWRRTAATLEDWHRTGRHGPRPHGRVRPHEPQPVSRLAGWWAAPFYRLVVDPDGRPRRLQREGRF